MNEGCHERRQRETAGRLLRVAMPDLQRVAREVARQHTHMTDVAKVISSAHQHMLADIAEQARQIGARQLSAKTLRVANITVPPLRLDYKSLFPRLDAIRPSALPIVMPALGVIQEIQHNQFTEIIALARNAVSVSLPPNWRGESVQIPRNFEELLLDEGLALAWVPPQHVLVRLFNAESSGARRKILGNNWRSITRACNAHLESSEDPALNEHVDFAQKAAHSLANDDHEVSQALSTNLLDTILRRSFEETDRRTITGRAQRLDIEEYPVRVAIVLGGIWGSYRTYRPERGDKVPRAYSRHGSAHGVSRRQYSRINALIALMHTVSLLKLLESDLVV